MSNFQRLIVVALFFVLSACVANTPKKGSDAEIARAHVELSAEYYRLGRLEYALESAKKALKADSTSAEANSLIAIIYNQIDMPDLAQEFFESAVEYTEFDTALYGRVHNNFGSFLCSHGQGVDAEAQFLMAAENKLYRTPQVAYENAGLCVLDRPDIKKAKKYFRAALEINPNLPRSIFELMQLSFAEQEYEQTLLFVERLSRLNAASAETLMLGVKSELVLGQIKKAKQRFEKLKRIHPDARESTILWESIYPNE